MRGRARGGLSAIEVVVLLVLLAIVAALVLPAMRSSKRGPRRIQCLNNERNVGLAIQNYASQNGGKLPTLHGDDGELATTADRYQSWPRQLLRVLDQPALDRELLAIESSDQSSGTGEFNTPYLQVLTCPEDLDSFQQPGGLSYVVNGGYGFFPFDRGSKTVSETGRHSIVQDWDGDGEVSQEEREITQATGVFWRPEPGFALTLDDLGAGDGTGSTLLVAENLHAGPWLGSDVRELAFVIGRERLTFNAVKRPLAVARADLGPFGINGGKEWSGPVPGPSSNHPGSVYVIWADGRGGALSESIDSGVYVRILTSAGTRYGQTEVDDGEI